MRVSEDRHFWLFTKVSEVSRKIWLGWPLNDIAPQPFKYRNQWNSIINNLNWIEFKFTRHVTRWFSVRYKSRRRQTDWPNVVVECDSDLKFDESHVVMLRPCVVLWMNEHVVHIQIDVVTRFTKIVLTETYRYVICCFPFLKKKKTKLN